VTPSPFITFAWTRSGHSSVVYFVDFTSKTNRPNSQTKRPKVTELEPAQESREVRAIEQRPLWLATGFPSVGQKNRRIPV